MCLANKAPGGLRGADRQMQPQYVVLQLSSSSCLSSEFILPSRNFRNRSFYGYNTLETISSAKRWKISKGAAVSSAVDKGDSKAVDEALEGKPEESHG